MAEQYYRSVPQTEELRQGDVLRRRLVDRENNQPKLLVTLTADCDIAQRKTGGVITCVQVVSVPSYLDTVLAPAELAKEAQSRERGLIEMVFKHDQQRDQNVERMTRETLATWLRERGAKGIAHCLGMDKSQTKKFMALASELNLIWDSDKGNAWERLVKVWQLTKKEKAIKNSLRSKLTKELPEDMFFVPTLPGEKEMGFIVKFRALFSLADCEICYGSRQIGDCSYERIGRFSNTLRFAIAQRAMFVFARIGLNVPFEVDTQAAIELICDDYDSLTTQLATL